MRLYPHKLIKDYGIDAKNIKPNKFIVKDTMKQQQIN